MRRVVLTGSRQCNLQRGAVNTILRDMDLEWPDPDTQIAHGGAMGWDRLCHDALLGLGWAESQIEVFLPNYDKHHAKRAPLARNDVMLNWALMAERCSIVGMLPRDGWGKGGTFYTLKNALQMGFEVHVFRFSTSPTHPECQESGE